MTKRKKYSPEFKTDAVRLVTEQGYSQSEAGRSLGIKANMLSRWIRQQNNDEEFVGNGKLTEDQRQIRELKQRVKQLEMEKDILKKATVFFAAETR